MSHYNVRSNLSSLVSKCKWAQKTPLAYMLSAHNVNKAMDLNSAIWSCDLLHTI